MTNARDALIAREMAAFATPLRAASAATAKPSIVIDDAYAAALRGVQAIDARLEAGYHFRAADGRLLTTLEEVVRALQAGSLKVADGRKVADE